LSYGGADAVALPEVAGSDVEEPLKVIPVTGDIKPPIVPSAIHIRALEGQIKACEEERRRRP
jgi:hypothetical protein